VLGFYTQVFEFEGLEFVDALRSYLTPFRLPGEAQKIDRIMQSFSAHYHTSNPTVFSCADTAYIFAFSLIMLNTDAHSTHVSRKMTEDEFIRNNRGIDQGADISVELLRAAYRDIVRTEIKTMTQFEELTQAELVNWLAQGSVFIKFTHGRVGAVKSPHHEIRLWIAGDELRYVNSSKRSRGEKAYPLSAVSDVLAGSTSNVFRKLTGDRRRRRSREELRADLFFSLVLKSRTIDLQAGSPELADFWVRYFKEVVERSRLEATARRIAMRAQPREAFVEMAERVWAMEILPAWDEEQGAERTRLLWWEGLPPSQRAKVWMHALDAHPDQRRGRAASPVTSPASAARRMGSPAGSPSGSATSSRAAAAAAVEGSPAVADSGSHAQGSDAAADSAAEAGAIELARAWLDEQLPRAMADLFSLYGHPSSPMRAELLRLLVALQREALAEDRPETWLRRAAPAAPLLGSMLLTHLEPPLAYTALRLIVREHAPGKMFGEGRDWRNRAFKLVLEQELPAVQQCLLSLGIAPDDYFELWLQALFVHILPLETCSRLWDCYLRDGEVLVWRAALELLRLRSNALISECAGDSRAAMRLLNSPIDAVEIPEARLFKSLYAHEGGVSGWLPLLHQRPPLPERCFDLHANSYDSSPQPSKHASLSASDDDDDDEDFLSNGRSLRPSTATTDAGDDSRGRHVTPTRRPGSPTARLRALSPIHTRSLSRRDTRSSATRKPS